MFRKQIEKRCIFEKKEAKPLWNIKKTYKLYINCAENY